MNKFLFYIIFLIVGGVSFSGCKKFLDKTDPTATTFKEFFNDESDLRRVVYSSFRDVFDNKGERKLLFYMWDGKSDNAYSRVEGDNHQLIGNGQFDSNTRAFEYYYTLHMKHIARINRYIENIERPYVDDEATRQKYLDNLKCLRIWHYFILTSHFGDVPFITKPVTLEEATIPSSSKKDILDSLFKQGRELLNTLPDQKYTSDKYMFHKWNFEALLMRYALYNERYDLAIKYAKEIMDSHLYQLYPVYGDLFQHAAAHNNDEFILWQSRNSYDGNTWTYNHLGPPYRTSNGDSYLVPLKSLVDAYWTKEGYAIDHSPLHSKEEYELDPGLDRDPRYRASIFGNGDDFYGETVDIYDKDDPLYYKNTRSSASGFWFRKWIDHDDVFKGSNDFEFGLIRYSEVLLTYAEAKIMQNDMDALAKECINQVRSRAGLDMSEADVTLPRYSGYSHDQWVQLIRRERRIEFAGEGQRYDDIIRWKIAEDVQNKPALGATRKVDGRLQTIHVEDRSFKPYNYVWPFHSQSLKTNPNLKQKTGY